MTDSTPNSCCVYIIQDAHGAVKIGIAANADQRLRDLQVGNPHELKLLYKMQFASRKVAQDIEGILHRRYADDSLRGEWFSTNAERLIADVDFAVSVGAAIHHFAEERPAPPQPEPSMQRRRTYTPQAERPVRLSAAQLDEVARWAIQRGYICFSDLINIFQFDRRTANAVLYTFNKFGCLLPLKDQPGYYQYDPEWKIRQGVQA